MSRLPTCARFVLRRGGTRKRSARYQFMKSPPIQGAMVSSLYSASSIANQKYLESIAKWPQLALAVGPPSVRRTTVKSLDMHTPYLTLRNEREQRSFVHSGALLDALCLHALLGDCDRCEVGRWCSDESAVSKLFQTTTIKTINVNPPSIRRLLFTLVSFP